MNRVDQIIAEFDRLREEQGISVPISNKQAIELSLQAGYNVGYNQGFEDAKNQIMQKLGEELIG